MSQSNNSNSNQFSSKQSISNSPLNNNTPIVQTSFNNDILPQFTIPSTNSCRKELEYSTRSSFSSNISPTQLHFTPKSKRSPSTPSTASSSSSTIRKRKRGQFEQLPSID